MFKDIGGSIVRHFLTTALGGFAAWLIKNGATAEDAELIVTGIATAGVFAWSFWQKAKKNKEVKLIKEEKSEIEKLILEKVERQGLRNKDFNH